MTYSTAADDILLRLYAGAPSDDVQIEKSQVIHLIGLVRDSLVRDYMSKMKGQGKAVDTNFTSQQNQLKCVIEQGVETPTDRFYVTLASTPLTIDNDNGVILVEDEEGIELGKMRVNMRGMYRNLRYAKPSFLNLNWYRDGKKVYIEGLDERNFEEKRFNVLYVPSSEGALATDEVKVGTDIMGMILDSVEEILRRQMSDIVEIENNGVEDDRK